MGVQDEWSRMVIMLQMSALLRERQVAYYVSVVTCVSETACRVLTIELWVVVQRSADADENPVMHGPHPTSS